MRAIISAFLFSVLLITGSLTAFAHGGEEEGFNAKLSVEQSIIALDQRQPNVGVIMQKLNEINENSSEVTDVDVPMVNEALALVEEGEYEEASEVLFQAIGVEPNEDALFGNPLLEYEEGFAGKTSEYLLLISAFIFIIIGGLLLQQQKKG